MVRENIHSTTQHAIRPVEASMGYPPLTGNKLAVLPVSERQNHTTLRANGSMGSRPSGYQQGAERRAQAYQKY